MTVSNDLPSNTITIRDGQVQQVQDWTCWNGVNWPTVTIDRNGDGTFTGDIGDPEHGGAVRTGSLDEAIGPLHQKFADPLRQAFALENADAPSLASLGFDRYEIVNQDKSG